MKKIFYLFGYVLLLSACDRYYYNQLYIINNCDQSVCVSITNTWNTIDTFYINANTMIMFNEGEGISSPKGIIERSFIEFEVTKNGVKSKVNYCDINRWIYEEDTDEYHSKLYLPINPEDFE